MMISSWGALLSEAESLDLAHNLASVRIDQCGPLSPLLCALLKERNYKDLCDLEIDYSDPAWAADTLINARQVLALFTKMDFLDIGVDKKEAAWSTFKEAEQECLTTNTIFRLWREGKFSFLPRVESYLFLAQQKIASVLGEVPTLDELHFRFGPGASIGIKKRDASAKMKLSGPLTCSDELLPYASSVLEEMPGWVKNLASSEDPDRYVVPIDIVSSKVAFVPKSPKTYRTIAVEPLLNSMGQLAIGDVISDRLLRVGVDLSDQTRNQRLAREGSLTGELATLDLSSASDTVSYELVHHLLPPDWAELLCRFRTGTMLDPDGVPRRLQKFSSMGNGFTFPLESLIFWALTRSVCASGVVSVYGDDIILPSAYFDELRALLQVCGFTVNKKKSFSTGQFRESCGADYFKGVDIRPVYIKERLCGQDIFRLYNFFARRYEDDYCEHLVAVIPDEIRLYGPDGFGDGHLITHSNDWGRRHKPQCGWAGRIFDTYTYGSRKDMHPRPGDAVLPAYTIYAKHGKDRYGVELPYANMHTKSLNDDNFTSVRTRAVRGVKTQVPVGTLPGKAGFKRISIYTLLP